jgi:hypothetical protein
MRLPRVIFVVASICSIVCLPAQAQNRGRRNNFGSSLFGGVISDGLRGGASFIGGLFTGHSRGGGSYGSERRGSNNQFRGGFSQPGYQGPGPAYNPRLFPAGEPVYRPRFQGGYGAPGMVVPPAIYGSPAYNFDYAQPYAYAPQYPAAPQYAPDYHYASQPGYAPVYNQSRYDQPRYSSASWSEPYSSVPDYYMIAFNDGSIQAALAYSVDGDILRWTTRNHLEKRAPVAAVDRYFSEQLNRDRRVEFRLP